MNSIVLKFIIIVVLNCFSFFQIVAQDSLQVKKIEQENQLKTQKMYQNFQEYSKKNKWTEKIHRLIFEVISVSKDKNITEEYRKKQRNFKSFQGKKIRKIEIKTFDPFGFSQEDTTAIPNKWEALGNLFHNKTKKVIIRSQLLLNENQPFDSILLKESERILRSQRYIRGVLIVPKIREITQEVDINIYVLDAWTMLVDASGSFNEFSVRGQEHNLFGLGNFLSLRYNQRIKSPYLNGYSVAYEYPNIYNTQINLGASYNQDYEKLYQKRFYIQRPYFSIYTRWIAAAIWEQKTYRERIHFADTSYVKQIKSSQTDFWAGMFFPILKNKMTKRQAITLNISFRYQKTRFIDSPFILVDDENFYTNKELFLSSIGIHNIDYQQDRYIFRHNEVEDIPTGKMMSFLTGISKKTLLTEPYLGFRYRYAFYKKIGYISADFQIGSFFQPKVNKQTTFKAEVNYFSKLIPLYHWYFRQFIKMRSVIGIHRNKVNDRITLNEEDQGILGLNNSYLKGTRKTILTFQTQFYMPFSWWGFRVSPFFTFDVGAIGNTENYIWKDQFLTKFGIGFYITNNYLVFDSIQFSFFYFPRIPGVGTHIHKFTGTGNKDFSLPIFDYHKPEVINYR